VTPHILLLLQTPRKTVTGRFCENTQQKKAVPPSLMIQYSVEKHDMALPMLFGAMIKLENRHSTSNRVLKPVWANSFLPDLRQDWDSSSDN